MSKRRYPKNKSSNLKENILANLNVISLIIKVIEFIKDQFFDN